MIGLIGAVGGVAAASAAAWSARIAALSSRPFAYAVPSKATESGVIRIMLYNVGPVMVISMKCRFQGGEWEDMTNSLAAGQAIPAAVTAPAALGLATAPGLRGELSDEMVEGLVTEVAFSGLDGSRWLVTRTGTTGEPERQRLRGGAGVELSLRGFNFGVSLGRSQDS